MTRQFIDRVDAGVRLAESLRHLRGDHPIVVGLPRGGVPVAAQVARVLETPLDVLVVRKLGYPHQPELGIGAIGEGGVTVLNQKLIAELHLTQDDLGRIERKERAELERRVRVYRGDRTAEEVEGQTVIIVDDGIATGSTARAAIAVVRAGNAERIVVAAPVVSPREAHDLRSIADDLIALESSTKFFAIGQFYKDFSSTTDEEVRKFLSEA